MNTRETRPRLLTLDSRLGTLGTRGSRLKAEDPVITRTGHLQTAPHHPPEPHRRRASAASAALLSFLLLLLPPPLLLAGAGYTVVSKVQFPPPTPCTAKVLDCVVQHRRYSTATMAPCPWNPGVLGAVVRYILISRLISKPHCQLITA